MCDEWMPTLRLRLARHEFDQLPRHPAYKYEYLNGTALLSPWPRHLHAVLDLSRLPDPPVGPHPLRPVQRSDEAALVDVFAAAFRRVQPFGALDEPTLRVAAQQCLTRALGGGDGPWVEAASFAAHSPGSAALVGASLITLVPGGAPATSHAYLWQEEAPADLWQRGAGQPHLTWICVHPWHRTLGIGSALLHASGRVLREHGYTSLWTTFLVGNDASMLWHWRNRFELV
jgi:ribosomal protein S18 acetylase RimI-like enzyme